MKLNDLNKSINEARGDIGDYDLHLYGSMDNFTIQINNIPRITIPTPHKEELYELLYHKDNLWKKDETMRNIRSNIFRLFHEGRKERKQELDKKVDELIQSFILLLRSLAIEYVNEETNELSKIFKELETIKTSEEMMQFAKRYGLI